MEFLLPLATLAFVQLLAVISPGQSFVVVSKLALSEGRPAALSATFGLGVGTIIWAVAAIFGLALVLENATWLYAGMKFAGGLYLLFMAVMLWKGAPTRPDMTQDIARNISAPRAFLLGVTTQLANPKVVIFFGSIFFALLPENSTNWVYFVSVVIVFLNETIWYSLVSVFFSVEKTRRLYLRAKVWIDRVMALALGALGLGLAMDAGRSFLTQDLG